MATRSCHFTPALLLFPFLLGNTKSRRSLHICRLETQEVISALCQTPLYRKDICAGGAQ